MVALVTEKSQSHHVFDIKELRTVSVPKIWSGSWGISLDVSVRYRAVRTRPCSATAGPGSSKPSDFNSFHGSKDSEQYWSHLQTSIANFRSKLSWAIDWILYHSIPFRIGFSNAVNPWSAWTLDCWTNTWDSKLCFWNRAVDTGTSITELQAVKPQTFQVDPTSIALHVAFPTPKRCSPIFL